MRFVQILTAFGLATTVLMMPIATVQACSCARFTVQEAIAAANIAFVGTLTATSEAPDPMNMDPITWRFDVERANREVSGGVIDLVATADSGANCGVSFGIGERWLILATRQDQALTTSSCAGNMPMDGADAQIVAFVEDLPTVAPPPAPESEPVAASSGNAWPVVIGIGLVVVLAGLAAIGLARRANARAS